MRKIIASSLVTLDGVVEDPGGMAGSEHGGWANRYFDEVAAKRSLERLDSCDYFLCGRRTYEMFSKGWPNASGPYADRLNNMPKLVASTTLVEPLTWNATLLKGDAVGELARLGGEEGGDIMMYGSGTLMWSLLEHGLVDELILWICPIVLATGQQIFAGSRPRVELELTGHTDLHTGVVIASYRPLPTATT